MSSVSADLSTPSFKAHIDNTVQKLEKEAKEYGLSSEEHEAYMRKINGIVSGIFKQIDQLQRIGNTEKQILEAANLQVKILNQSGKALLKDKNAYLEEKKNTLQELENSKGVISGSNLPPHSFTPSELKKKPSLSSILPKTNSINFLHGIKHEPITPTVVVGAINEIAAPIKFVEDLIGNMVEKTCRTTVGKPFCHSAKYLTEAIVDNAPDAVRETCKTTVAKPFCHSVGYIVEAAIEDKWVERGLTYLEEKQGIPRNLIPETVHSLLSLTLTAPAIAGLTKAALKTGAKALENPTKALRTSTEDHAKVHQLMNSWELKGPPASQVFIDEATEVSVKAETKVLKPKRPRTYRIPPKITESKLTYPEDHARVRQLVSSWELVGSASEKQIVSTKPVAEIIPKVLKEAQIPHSWLGFESAELKVGTYSIVRDGKGTYLSLRVDGLYSNGEVGTLRHLINNISQEASKHQATRLFLTTEFRNQRLEQVLSSRYGLQLIEKNVRGQDNLYSLSVEKISKVSAPKAQTASVKSTKK